MQKTYTDAKGQVLSDTKIDGCSIASYTKCPNVDLSGQYLQGAFLSYADLSGADLSGVNLKAGSISFGNFRDVNFKGAELSATSMVRTKLQNGDLTKTQMVLNDNTEAKMRSVKLDGSIIASSTFVGADLSQASFTKAVVNGVSFNKADISGVDFTGANLAESNFVGAIDDGTKWDGAKFCNTLMPDGSVRGETDSECPGAPAFGLADDTVTMTPENPLYEGAVAAANPESAHPYGDTVRGCKLEQRTECVGSNLDGENLTNVLMGLSDLRRMNISGAKGEGLNIVLTDARDFIAPGVSFISGGFSISNLSGADLTGTTWSFASASLANMRGADLSGADLDFSSFIGADLTGANMTKVNLSDSNAIGINLTDADLSGANLSDADLTGATIKGADFKGATYCNTVMPNGSVKKPQKGLCPGQDEP